jgi:hypothetical protein
VWAVSRGAACYAAFFRTDETRERQRRARAASRRPGAPSRVTTAAHTIPRTPRRVAERHSCGGVTIRAPQRSEAGGLPSASLWWLSMRSAFVCAGNLELYSLRNVKLDAVLTGAFKLSAPVYHGCPASERE